MRRDMYRSASPDDPGPTRLLLKNRYRPSGERLGPFSFASVFKIGPRLTGASQGRSIARRCETQRSKPWEPDRVEEKYNESPSLEIAGFCSWAVVFTIGPRLTGRDQGP